MGGNGVAAALRLAKLEHLSGNHHPDTLDCDVSFEDFAAVNQAIVEMYGPKGQGDFVYELAGPRSGMPWRRVG